MKKDHSSVNSFHHDGLHLQGRDGRKKKIEGEGGERGREREGGREREQEI